MSSLPKILHLYWGGNQPLSYFRYLTVASFVKHNPEWTVNVWTPKDTNTKEITWNTGEQIGTYSGHDYLDDLCVCKINMESIGIPDNIPEVHKSDLLRWYLLGEFGGVWSDFDILYTAPLSKNITKNWGDVGLCYYELPFKSERNHKFQAIGFLASSGDIGKEFFMKLFEKGIAKIPQTEYQAFGADLLECHLQEWSVSGRPYFYLDKDLVYPYYAHDSVQNYFNPVPLHHPNSIGLHWYAGHPFNGPHAATITEGNIRDKAIAYSICKEALKVI